MLEPSAKFSGSQHPVCAELECSGHGQDAGQVLGAWPITLFLTTDRFEICRITNKQSSDTRRAAEFVRGQGNEVGVGQRELAAALGTIGDQQPPRARTSAAISASGWTIPVSLLTCCTATTGRSPAIASVRTRPAPSTGNRIAAGAARNTASCSTADT
jgi:hypothetical protein